MPSATSPDVAVPRPLSAARVILASSLGTGFEWYDFFLYGSLADVLSKQFFSALNETNAFIFALLTFAAGFAVRPFGALLFGRLGDRVGRKKTFLITLVIMGTATVLVGLLPNYQRIGLAAPAILIALRLMQGLAIGGEYGGALIYVAEHAPPGARGGFTSWIPMTATLALLLSLIVILICRITLGDEFAVWGWRIPFLLSTVLLIVSVYIRLRLAESPVFARMVAEGSRSHAPIRESFGEAKNLKRVLAVLAGTTAGQNVLWYGGQLYVLYFLTQTLKVEAATANLLLVPALLIATPLYWIAGRLSDHIGRKPVVIAGMLLAVLTYFPIYHAITHFANPAIEQAARNAPVTVLASPGDCSAQFDPIGRRRYTHSCDVAKSTLARFGVPYETGRLPDGRVATVRLGRGEYARQLPSFAGDTLSAARFAQQNDDFAAELRQALQAVGYPARADPARVHYAMLIVLITILAAYATIVTGPLAAWLPELFPARIRYTAMSVPYHIGAGWFGGFMPAVTFALVAITGDIYSGLWYPIIIIAVTVIAGAILLPETAGPRATEDMDRA
jgi:predicted MFS family arabinose efflux permease